MFSHLSNSIEVQQRLVDWSSGEGRLRHRLHPEPAEAGKHPTSAGTEEGTLPRVSSRGEDRAVGVQEAEEAAGGRSC